jgi:myosin heavy subunit
MYIVADNSSRFGKWMKVGFDNAFRIQGCEIINYLLEKSRVVAQSQDERNYHIFYQIIAAADSAMKTRLKLKSPQDYFYLNQSGCMQIKGVDDAQEFKEVLEAMQTLQFSASTVEAILKILAGILLLGNLQFEGLNGDSETAKLSPSSESLMKDCAELLGLEVIMFNYSLANKRVQMGRWVTLRHHHYIYHWHCLLNVSCSTS